MPRLGLHLAWSIEGITLWLDAANIDGQSNAGLNNGDAISKWTRFDGNGNHAVQDNEGDRPSYNLLILKV